MSPCCGVLVHCKVAQLRSAGSVERLYACITAERLERLHSHDPSRMPRWKWQQSLHESLQCGGLPRSCNTNCRTMQCAKWMFEPEVVFVAYLHNCSTKQKWSCVFVKHTVVPAQALGCSMSHLLFPSPGAATTLQTPSCRAGAIVATSLQPFSMYIQSSPRL